MIVTQIAPFTFFLRPIGSYSIPQKILMKLDIPCLTQIWEYPNLHTHVFYYFIGQKLILHFLTKCIYFFPIMTILFDIFEMFRISKSNRAFTKYMIEIANYAIMPLKGFLLGIFLSVWSSIAQVLSGRQIEDSARMSISPPMGRLYDK